MSTYFEQTDTLFSITDRYPETIAVFVSNGFPQMENPEQRDKFGKMITFDVALQLKQQNPDTFIDLLEEVISGERGGIDATLAKAAAKDENGLNVVGLLPCPVRIPLLEKYNTFYAEYLENGGTPVNTELKAASVGVDWVSKNLEGVTDPKDLPDLFISAGFDLFFDKEKIGKFRDQGVFEDLVKRTVENPLFAGRGFEDPEGIYSIIATVPAVFLVNTKELNGRPTPKSWKDLLDPMWEHSVSLPVGDFDLFNAILLNMHKHYGDEGIRALGRSMIQSMHPSQMVKSDRLTQNRPAITIMPYFFTKMTKSGGPMEAIWPEDGAIVSPVFMLAKKERKAELQPLVDFFSSYEVGDTMANLGLFPSLHGEVKNPLESGVPMMWLGWDSIRGGDLTAEIARLMDLFDDEYKNE